MPEVNFCPHCGGKLRRKALEAEERDRLVCEKCSHIYYQNPVPVAAAVLTKPNHRKVGLIKRALPPQEEKWALPGGFVEIDESPEEAILREVKEEVGVSGEIKGLISVHSDKSRTYHRVIMIGYQVEVKETNFSLGREAIEFKFFPLSQHPPLAFPSHSKVLLDFQKTYRNPIPTVDAILEINGGIVLVKRKNPPYGWALPGGFVDYGETLEQAVRRELKEEVNLEIDNMYQLHTFSKPERDPRFHTISTVFVAKATGELIAGDDAGAVRVFPKQKLPSNLAFDHHKIVQYYLERK